MSRKYCVGFALLFITLACNGCGIILRGARQNGSTTYNNGTAGMGLTTGNGQVTSLPRTVAPFHGIVVNGSMDVTATVGSKTSVVVTGDSNIVSLVRTISQNGEITIDTQGNYSTKNPLTVTIVTPSLDGMSVNGSGSITAHSLSAGHMSMNLSGSGSIDADGAATALSADLEGSGNINAQNVTAPQANVEVNGSGNVTVNATKSIKANLNGSGNITYYGNPSTTANQTNGSGSITKA